MPVAVVALIVAIAAVTIFLLGEPNESSDRLDQQVSAQDRRITSLSEQNELLRTMNEDLVDRVGAVETLSRRVGVVEAESDSAFELVQQICQSKALADVPQCQGD